MATMLGLWESPMLRIATRFTRSRQRGTLNVETGSRSPRRRVAERSDLLRTGPVDLLAVVRFHHPQPGLRDLFRERRQVR